MGNQGEAEVSDAGLGVSRATSAYVSRKAADSATGDLRAEQMTASAAIASGTGKTARILERVTPDGDAIAVRTAA